VGRIPDRKLTDTRPQIIDEKIRVGDWGKGVGKTAYIAAFVDKTTKLLREK
jgi:hypothetical protein